MICSALTKNLVFSYWPGDFKLFFALDVTRALDSSAALDETQGGQKIERLVPHDSA